VDRATFIMETDQRSPNPVALFNKYDFGRIKENSDHEDSKDLECRRLERENQRLKQELRQAQLKNASLKSGTHRFVAEHCSLHWSSPDADANNIELHARMAKSDLRQMASHVSENSCPPESTRMDKNQFYSVLGMAKHEKSEFGTLVDTKRQKLQENQEKKLVRRRNVKSLYSHAGGGALSPFKYSTEIKRRRTEWGVVAPKRPYTDDTPLPPSSQSSTSSLSNQTTPQTPLPTPPPPQGRPRILHWSLLNSPRLKPELKATITTTTPPPTLSKRSTGQKRTLKKEQAKTAHESKTSSSSDEPRPNPLPTPPPPPSRLPVIINRRGPRGGKRRKMVEPVVKRENGVVAPTKKRNKGGRPRKQPRVTKSSVDDQNNQKEETLPPPVTPIDPLPLIDSLTESVMIDVSQPVIPMFPLNPIPVPRLPTPSPSEEVMPLSGSRRLASKPRKRWNKDEVCDLSPPSPMDHSTRVTKALTPTTTAVGTTAIGTTRRASEPNKLAHRFELVKTVKGCKFHECYTGVTRGKRFKCYWCEADFASRQVVRFHTERHHHQAIMAKLAELQADSSNIFKYTHEL